MKISKHNLIINNDALIGQGRYSKTYRVTDEDGKDYAIQIPRRNQGEKPPVFDSWTEMKKHSQEIANIISNNMADKNNIIPQIHTIGNLSDIDKTMPNTPYCTMDLVTFKRESYNDLYTKGKSDKVVEFLTKLHNIPTNEVGNMKSKLKMMFTTGVDIELLKELKLETLGNIIANYGTHLITHQDFHFGNFYANKTTNTCLDFDFSSIGGYSVDLIRICRNSPSAFMMDVFNKYNSTPENQNHLLHPLFPVLMHLQAIDYRLAAMNQTLRNETLSKKDKYQQGFAQLHFIKKRLDKIDEHPKSQYEKTINNAVLEIRRRLTPKSPSLSLKR